jgi:RimJ/RimL family protein N-acetyltransferase
MLLQLPRLTIRDWRSEDAGLMAGLANDYEIWRHVRDRFPHPYATSDAEAFIALALSQEPRQNFAIAIAADDAVIGSIGVIPGEDVYRRSAEVGYWLGRPYWGRGYATEALAAFSDWALEQYDLIRIFARVFVGNPASARALEKCGYERTARIPSAAVKEGRVVDEWIYSRIRPAAAARLAHAGAEHRHGSVGEASP